MPVVNGVYQNSVLRLSDSYKIISCFFINSSNRAIFLNSPNSRFLILYSFFENCSSRGDTSVTASGGCIYASSHITVMKKCRSFASESNYEGSFCCFENTKALINQISISKIIYTSRGHYSIRSSGTTTASNINVTDGKLYYDIGLSLKPNLVQFVAYKNLIARTLFRNSDVYQYGNIVDCSAEGFTYGSITMKNFYLKNVKANCTILYPENSNVKIIDCIFISVTGITASTNVILSKSQNSGASYNCLDRIPLICDTLKYNPCRRTHITNVAIIILIKSG